MQADHDSRVHANTPAQPGRRRLLAIVPATVALGVLSAACGQSSAPAPKSSNEQASKPADQQAAQSKPAAAASPAAASKEGAKPVANGKQWSSPPAMAIDQTKKYTATIKTDLGEMTADLFVKDAPNTVNNFVFLAKEGFYDGVIFHRIIRDFMVQTGDPTGTGRGSPGYRFNDELAGPEGYTKGTLAMANAGPNTQGSQFFICHGPGAERLPKNYTIFGRVTQGIETLDKIATVQVQRGPSGENSSPVTPPKIESVTIKEG